MALSLSPALEPVCYVTVDMLSRSMRRTLVPRMNTRQFGTVKLMVSKFVRRLLDVNAKYQQGGYSQRTGAKKQETNLFCLYNPCHLMEW